MRHRPRFPMFQYNLPFWFILRRCLLHDPIMKPNFHLCFLFIVATPLLTFVPGELNKGRLCVRQTEGNRTTLPLRLLVYDRHIYCFGGVALATRLSHQPSTVVYTATFVVGRMLSMYDYFDATRFGVPRLVSTLNKVNSQQNPLIAPKRPISISESTNFPFSFTARRIPLLHSTHMCNSFSL
jgi:hypothetical protein